MFVFVVEYCITTRLTQATIIVKITTICSLGREKCLSPLNQTCYWSCKRHLLMLLEVGYDQHYSANFLKEKHNSAK